MELRLSSRVTDRRRERERKKGERGDGSRVRESLPVENVFLFFSSTPCPECVMAVLNKYIFFQNTARTRSQSCPMHVDIWHASDMDTQGFLACPYFPDSK
jgi:hypothetical protein